MKLWLPIIMSSVLVLSACGGGGSDTASKSDDIDFDTIVNSEDNCPASPNLDQLDANNDGEGDVCDYDSDSDNDGIVDSKDGFPLDATKIASVQAAHRLLNQATFGPTEAGIDKIVGMGV
jgi:hypothetical protein